ncbi:MAG: DivIVA domain-containing protein [Actinomycetota bacterium]
MELGPRDIHDKQFHDEWRGYNREEVDDFLDRVAEALEQTQRAGESLTARVAELESQLSQAREGEQMLKKTLVTAQHHAEEAVASARARADKLVEEATERGRGLLEEARNKATTIESEARKKAQETERAGEQRKRDLESSIEKLRVLEVETKQKLKAFLDGQQRSLTALSERRTLLSRPAGTAAPSHGAGTQSSPQRSAAQDPYGVGGEAPRPTGGEPAGAGEAPSREGAWEAGDAGARSDSDTPDYDPGDDDGTARRSLRSLFGRDEE